MTKKKLPALSESSGEQFKKTNEAIGLRVSRGRLSFMSRKLLNVLMYHAQNLGSPGVNSPLQTETAHKYFWVPVAEISKDAHYNSNDTKLLKEVAEELQDIRIVSETEREWTSERLLASIKIVNPAGLHKRGGKLWLGYEFPAEVLNLVMSPKSNFTTLTLYYMTVLRTGAGLALYEMARANAWKPNGLSERRSWIEWRDYLEGMPGSEMPDWKYEYKFFKDRVLKKAITEVNTLTDLEVELFEYKTGRRVSDLQFKIKKKSDASLSLLPPPLINSKLIEQLCRLGFLRQEAEALYSTHDPDDIVAALDYTQIRLDNKQLEPLDAPQAYFKSALRGKYGATKKRVAEQEKKPSLRLPAKVEVPKPDPTVVAARRAALEAYDIMPDVERARVFAAFVEGHRHLAATAGKKPTSPLVRKPLAEWLLAAMTEQNH